MQTRGVLYPPDEPPFEVRPTEPVVFFAGPIEGAPEWQFVAEAFFPEYLVANPRTRPGNPREFNFKQQVAWESRWLARAAAYGVLLFWMPPEAKHLCHRAYAQTTRFEFSEWRIKKPEALVVGAHPDFPGRRYIQERLSTDNPTITLHTTLADTIDEARRRLREMK